MQVIKMPLGQLQTNCFLLMENSECLIIDPADEATFILEEIQRRKLKLVGLLATHGHFDHVLATGEIQRSIPVPLYLFKEDQFLIRRLNETAKYFLGFDPYALEPEKCVYLQEKKMKIGEFNFEIIKTPGHTPGGCCFYFEKENIVFSGDTLFRDGIGRYDFSYSDRNILRQSVKKILSLPGETKVLSGHGEQTSVSSAIISMKRELYS